MQDVVDVNLIITDYCMPGMTGYDLLRKIKVYIYDSMDIFSENFLSLCHFFLHNLASISLSEIGQTMH